MRATSTLDESRSTTIAPATGRLESADTSLPGMACAGATEKPAWSKSSAPIVRRAAALLNERGMVSPPRTASRRPEPSRAIGRSRDGTLREFQHFESREHHLRDAIPVRDDERRHAAVLHRHAPLVGIVGV